MAVNNAILDLAVAKFTQEASRVLVETEENGDKNLYFHFSKELEYESGQFLRIDIPHQKERKTTVSFYYLIPLENGDSITIQTSKWLEDVNVIHEMLTIAKAGLSDDY